MKESRITVYGAENCGNSARTRNRLDYLGVPYRYIGIDEDENARQMVMIWNDGCAKTPTVVFDDDLANKLVEPSDPALDAALVQHRLLDAIR